MILRLAWVSTLVFAGAVIFFSALVGAVWVWSLATAPPTEEAEALKARLAEREESAEVLFPEDWQALCVLGPYQAPLEVIARGTALAQTPCTGWQEDWQVHEDLGGLLLVTGRSCRAVPLRRDIIDSSLLAGQCFRRVSRPVLSLDARGTPPRDFLMIR